MRKLFTLFLLTLFVWEAWGQTCIVYGSDYATNFINCANDPLTEIIEFGPPPRPSGYGTIFITGTNPVIDLTGITIYVPKKIRLVFSGNVLIDDETNFQTTPDDDIQGNSEVQFGLDGTAYKGNPGINGFDILNGLIVSCSMEVDPMACIEIESFLPVELTDFQGKAVSSGVELIWITATELNNDYFAVEHSTDGLAFRSVGQVKGAGSSTEELSYNFTHRKPVSGTNYYRLKQVDFDGSYEYSSLIAVEILQRSGSVRLFPNPTIDRVFLQFEGQLDGDKIHLSNLVGNRIDRTPKASDSGWEVDLSGLPSGIYFLRMEANGKTLTRRIVKE